MLRSYEEHSRIATKFVFVDAIGADVEGSGWSVEGKKYSPFSTLNSPPLPKTVTATAGRDVGTAPDGLRLRRIA